MNDASLTRLLAIAVAVSLAPLTSAASAGRLSSAASVDRNGPWIAYSTAPVCAANQVCTGGEQSYAGSDVFMVRAGVELVEVAGRGSGRAWNICPVFSPNGRMLAFARESGQGQSWKQSPVRSTIVVVRIRASGPVATGRRVLHVPGGLARCPEWSSDSSRVAYIAHDKVVVLGLDGKRRHWEEGDPTSHDFIWTSGGNLRRTNGIVSPTGELIASEDQHTSVIVVSRPDGSDRRVVPEQGGDPQGEPSYAIAGWSPDGRKLLLMYDVGGFRMCTVSVTAPFASEILVDDVFVDNPRLWPGYGDVSWQPIPTG